MGWTVMLSLIFICLTVPAPAQSRLAIVGGTVIDTADWGRSTHDLEDAVILCVDGRITAVGPRRTQPVPEGYRVIDAQGRFVVPGLVDGFAVLNNQAYANAYLALGVTSIVGVWGGRRGPMFWEADPGPHIYPLDEVGLEAGRSLDQRLARVDRLAAKGAAVLLLMYQLDPVELRAVAQRARERGLGTIGELARSTYLDGLQSGLDAFVHTTRYSLGLASDKLRLGVAREPFSDDLKSPKWRYYGWLSRIDPQDPRVDTYARRLAASGISLIPTASLLYLHRSWAINPWREPAAHLLDPKTIDHPADPGTGKPPWTAEQAVAYRALARNTDAIERHYRDAGCHYLAGSGSDVWGTMPGISLHTELESLVRFGHTPREALAAATSNFASTFGWREVGQVRAGCRADLLILKADPRQNVAALKKIQWVICRGSLYDPQDLLKTPGAQDGRLLTARPWRRPISYRGPDWKFLDGVKISAITYASRSNRVRGFLAQPRQQGRYPAVIVCRGGNREFGAFGDHRVAGLIGRIASWGYVVAASQYRGVKGGTGLEEFGGAEVHDVLNLLPLLDRQPQADTTRLGLVAGSRGVMDAFLALARSKRFRGAVFRAGVTDLRRWKRERPEMESVFEDLIPGYRPGRDDLLMRRSAVEWVDRLPKSCPILLLHGAADWRVSQATTVALDAALRRAGHPHRLVLFEGGDHSLSEYRREARHMTRSWLDRYVRDREPQPDLKPHGR